MIFVMTLNGQVLVAPIAIVMFPVPVLIPKVFVNLKLQIKAEN
jgi:hypothetical protein